jgi:hypothetical protein
VTGSRRGWFARGGASPSNIYVLMAQRANCVCKGMLLFKNACFPCMLESLISFNERDRVGATFRNLRHL